MYVDQSKTDIGAASRAVRAARQSSGLSVEDAPHVATIGSDGAHIVSFYKTSKAAKAGKQSGVLVVVEHISRGGLNRTRVLVDNR